MGLVAAGQAMTGGDAFYGVVGRCMTPKMKAADVRQKIVDWVGSKKVEMEVSTLCLISELDSANMVRIK